MKLLHHLYAGLTLVLAVALVLRVGAWLIAPLLPALGICFIVVATLLIALGGRPGRY